VRPNQGIERKTTEEENVKKGKIRLRSCEGDELTGTEELKMESKKPELGYKNGRINSKTFA